MAIYTKYPEIEHYHWPQIDDALTNVWQPCNALFTALTSMARTNAPRISGKLSQGTNSPTSLSTSSNPGNYSELRISKTRYIKSCPIDRRIGGLGTVMMFVFD